MCFILEERAPDSVTRTGFAGSAGAFWLNALGLGAFGTLALSLSSSRLSSRGLFKKIAGVGAFLPPCFWSDWSGVRASLRGT